MPSTIKVTKIEANPPSVGNMSSIVNVHVEVRTPNMNDLELVIQVPSHLTPDKILIEASNRVIQFAEDIKTAVEQNNGLRF